jgi:hypothetical protein
MEHLNRVQQIQNVFTQKLPKEPVALYELACFLAAREPMLITRNAGNLEK